MMRYYSHLQIQTLRALSIQPVHIETLEKFKELPLCSLFYHELIEQRGKWIGPTEKGFELIETFRRHNIQKRNKVAPLGPTIKKYVRRLNLVKKVA